MITEKTTAGYTGIVGARKNTCSAGGGGGYFYVDFNKAAWESGLIKPGYKYSIVLAQGTVIDGGELSKTVSKGFTVAAGKVKLTRDVASVSLYKANAHSSAIVTVYANGAPLPDSAKVTISNAAYSLTPLGGGKYAIGFAGVPPKKGAGVKLNVFLEGNYDPAAVGTLGYKANGSVAVTVGIK